MAVTKMVIIALALAVMAEAVKINTAELKEAMDEAEDVDDALDVVRHTMRDWGGDYKETLKGMPPLQLMDNGIALGGARDIMGKVVDNSLLQGSAEVQALAKAENRLAAAKQDVHEAANNKDAIKRAQLEAVAEELTNEAVNLLESTKVD